MMAANPPEVDHRVNSIPNEIRPARLGMKTLSRVFRTTTIESGGTKESALIKTHHNRVPELLRRIEAGEIVEPLAQFYKDEVRAIGRALGLPSQLIDKQPFPGPGLAVRFLCANERAGWSEHARLSEMAAAVGLRARVLLLRRRTSPRSKYIASRDCTF